jgi:hypothetical protein
MSKTLKNRKFFIFQLKKVNKEFLEKYGETNYKLRNTKKLDGYLRKSKYSIGRNVIRIKMNARK